MFQTINQILWNTANDGYENSPIILQQAFNWGAMVNSEHHTKLYIYN